MSINNLNNKFDLSDVSFLIPVRIDSLERLLNIQLVVRFIKEYFDTTVLMLEADVFEKVEIAEVDKKIFVRDSDPLFFHTRYRNQLVLCSKTPYVAIWDTDILMVPEQIKDAIELLRADKADMVLPYDGRVFNVPTVLRKLYQTTENLKVLTGNIKKFPLAYGKFSVGGAFIVNRKKYIKAGMENENFYGWGPEDFERVKRWEILGYKVNRIQGGLFHLPHPRGYSNNYREHHNRKVLQKELIRICKQDRQSLRTEVATWDAVRHFSLPKEPVSKKPESCLIELTNPLSTYVLNLKERIDRKEHVIKEFEGKPEFNVKIVEACEHQIGAVGLWLSIVKVIRLAKQQDEELILICEDDHYFTKHYEKEYLFQNIVEASQKGCEVLSGGIGGFGYAVPVATNQFWLDWFWCTQFIVVYKPFFQKILDYQFKEGDTADGVISQLSNSKITLYPFISEQKDFGYSDVTDNNNKAGLITKHFKDAQANLSMIAGEVKSNESI